jgi:hypothetical protein
MVGLWYSTVLCGFKTNSESHRKKARMFLLEGKVLCGRLCTPTSWLKLVGFKHLVQCLKYKHKWGGSYSVWGRSFSPPSRLNPDSHLTFSEMNILKYNCAECAQGNYINSTGIIIYTGWQLLSNMCLRVSVFSNFKSMWPYRTQTIVKIIPKKCSQCSNSNSSCWIDKTQ